MNTNVLKGVVIIEKDINEDLLAWAFPSLSLDSEQVLKDRCGLGADVVSTSFLFSRFDNKWQYMTNHLINEEGCKVTGVCICVLSEQYNPIKYKELVRLLLQQYLTTKSSVPVLQSYLSVYTKGKMDSSAGPFDDAAFDVRRALIAPVQDIFALYGMESILIWVAMLTKRRVFVYHENASELVNFIRCMPLLGAWHRQNWSLLRPLCTTSQCELDDLKSAGIYVAGFTDKQAESFDQYFDLFLDIPARSFIIPEHAKQYFVMTKFHKQTADAFMKAAEGGNEQAIIKAVALKTKELTDQLTSLQSDGDDGHHLKLTDIQEWTKKLPPNMVNDAFLYAVASAEGLTKKK